MALDESSCSLGVHRRTANEYDGLELVDLYLQKGANPRLRDWFGVTAIDRARSKTNAVGVHHMNMELWEVALKKMIEAIEKLEITSRQKLCNVCLLKLTILLAKEGGETNPNNLSPPLHEVAGIDISIRRCLTWAREALENGHDANKLDLESSAEKDLGRPLHAALHDRRQPTIPRITGKQKRYESLDLIDLFLEHGADSHLMDQEGKTPMEKAIDKLFSQGCSEFWLFALYKVDDAVDKLEGK
ncbi:hypothetical protein B0J13DRAFT_666593 [Dactylonectria estremocensis]|uniref:Uncharacterized protein n=1 Tax=Dactylonectria estremocensis TaxID=1079267 RepID=A0A9P9EWN9_9HYPO|nr:hypothetical protein B0J13DRAFT_666593 [Dactylonectria estremocensis]